MLGANPIKLPLSARQICAASSTAAQGMAGLMGGPPLIPTHPAPFPRLSTTSCTPMTDDAGPSTRAATAPFAAGNAPWASQALGYWDLLIY